MHKKVDAVRFWKDPEYRARMQAEGVELAHPAGLVEVSDERLVEASGFAIGPVQTTAPTCTMFSFRGWRYCCP
jgi:mersacidin/lichenicidin family type 2 lantibiotic